MKNIRKKVILLTALGLIIIALCCGQNADIQTENHPETQENVIFPWEKSRSGILDYSDMVLLYGGGSHRNYVWDEDHIAPYVTYVDKKGEEYWLFDCFLFLEIHDGNGRMFAQGYTQEPANQRDWRALADYYFQSKTAVGALNRAIEEASKRIGKPPVKRKIVIGLPEPILNQTDWGSVANGKPLDFSKTADRITACKWYIDYIRVKFNEMNYTNIELAGFYWIPEQTKQTGMFIKEIVEYVNKFNYSLNWIPYFGAEGYSEWKSFGFNYAYFQPNYFFNEATPESRLDEACALAKRYGLDMELEFDDRVMQGWGYRLTNYMNAFKKHNIWDNNRLAYYQGGIALYNLYKSSNEQARALYHEFCRFVIERPYTYKEAEKEF